MKGAMRKIFLTLEGEFNGEFCLAIEKQIIDR